MGYLFNVAARSFRKVRASRARKHPLSQTCNVCRLTLTLSNNRPRTPSTATSLSPWALSPLTYPTTPSLNPAVSQSNPPGATGTGSSVYTHGPSCPQRNRRSRVGRASEHRGDDGPYEAERAGPSGEEGGHQDRWEAHYRRFVVEKWGLRRRVRRLA